MFRSHLMKSLLVVAITWVSQSSISTAAIRFEDPAYIVGPLASAAVGPYVTGTYLPYSDGISTVLPGTNSRPFVGQDFWSDSIANNGGFISTHSAVSGGTVPYAPDGLYDQYNGEQALDTGISGSPNRRYVGARGKEPTLDYSTPNVFSLEFDFDLYIPSHGDEGSVGPWTDRNSDGLFDIEETGFHVGVFATGGPSVFPFVPVSAYGLTTATGVTWYSDGNGGVTTDIQSAMPVQDLGWHKVTVHVQDNADEVNFDVTVQFQFLSAVGPTGDFVDFDSTNPGVDHFTLIGLSTDELGMDRVESRDCRIFGNAPDGIFANVYRTAAIDNFDGFGWSCACIPEPSSLALFGMSSVGLVLRRNRR